MGRQKFVEKRRVKKKSDNNRCLMIIMAAVVKWLILEGVIAADAVQFVRPTCHLFFGGVQLNLKVVVVCGVGRRLKRLLLLVVVLRCLRGSTHLQLSKGFRNHHHHILQLFENLPQLNQIIMDIASSASTSTTTSKSKLFGTLFSHFQVELFLFVFIFSIAVEDVTVTLLAQDKFCMARFNRSGLCANLSKIQAPKPGDGEGDNVDGGVDGGDGEDLLPLLHAKDEILQQVTTFNFYQSVIYTVPVIFSSMFLSGWADRHRSSTKTLLCLTALAAALESIVVLVCAVYFDSNPDLILLAFIFFPLVGGSQSLGMAAISYLSSTTNSSERVKRFSILELTYIVSHPLGIFIGGIIIQNPQVTAFARGNGQLHNYHQVLALATACKLAAFSYAALMKFKRRPRSGDNLLENSVDNILETVDDGETAPLLFEHKGSKLPLKLADQRTKLQKLAANSADLFVWRNIAEAFAVATKRRPQRAHLFIWLLLTTMTIVTMTNRSVGVLMFQFVQKVYAWDAGTYSTVNSSLYIASHLFGLLLVTPILTRLVKVGDSSLLILGLISLFGQNFLRGTVIEVAAFAASYGFGSITSIIAVAVRTKLSRLAPPEEQNRLFGVLTMLETTAPLLGITVYSAVFNATLSWLPGFVFQLSCALLLIPLALAVYVAVAQERVMMMMVRGGGDGGESGDENNNRGGDTSAVESLESSTGSDSSKVTVVLAATAV